jgi:hypothetical protein
LSTYRHAALELITEPQRPTENREIGEGHAEVGLEDDQADRNTDKEHCNDHVPCLQTVSPAVGQPGGDHQDHGKADELARLDGQGTDGDPRSVAAASDTENQHRDQRDQTDPVQERCQTLENVEPHSRQQPQRTETDHPPQQLAQKQIGPDHTRHRVKGGQRSSHNADDGQYQPGIDAMLHSRFYPDASDAG